MNNKCMFYCRLYFKIIYLVNLVNILKVIMCMGIFWKDIFGSSV